MSPKRRPASDLKYPAMRRARWLYLLAGVLVFATALRVANLVDLADSPFYTRPVIDGQAYDQLATKIVTGSAPGEPFYQDPLYPYFLAGIYRVFGHSHTAVYTIQLLLALALVLLTYDTTRLLFDQRAGVAAALVAAAYKPFIFYESQVEKTALAVFLTGLFLWLLARSLRARSSPQKHRFPWPLNDLLCGIALGLAALTRSNVLLFAPLLPLALLLRPASIAPRSSPRLVPAALGLAGILLVIAPVSIRNSILAREVTLTTTQAGQNLYIGNSQYNSTGQYHAPPWVRPNPEYEQADFAEYANNAAAHAGRSLTYSGVSRFYARAAVEWARQNPAAFLKVLWRKTVLYFNNFEVPDNQDYYFFQRYSWILRLPLFSFGIVFAFGLAGIILLSRGLGPVSFAFFFFGYAASTIVFFVFSRYRIPALPALLPFAGAMVFRLKDAFSESPSFRAPRRVPRLLSAAALVLLVLACFAATAYPVHRGSGQRESAQCLTNLASTYWREGDTTKAVATFEEALKTMPGHAEAARNLGIIMLARGDHDRAFQLLSSAARSEPANPVTHVYLGRMHNARGELESAFLEFRRAVALAPGRVEYRFELARSLQELGDLRGALPQYDTMLRLAPDNAGVRHNYAVLLYNLGRLDEARAQIEEARRLGGTINPRFDSLLNSTTLGRQSESRR